MAYSLSRVRGCLRSLNQAVSRGSYSTAPLPASATKTWRVLEETRIPEFDIDAILLEHIVTRKKEENTFYVQEYTQTLYNRGSEF